MKLNRPITTAIILLVVVLLIFFLVWPEYNTFKVLRQELGEKRAEYNAKFEYYSAISKAYQDLQTRKDDLKKIDNALPLDSNLGYLVYFFQKKAEESGIIIDNVYLTKANKPTEGQIGEIVFSMSLSGNYNSLENYIISLEKSSRIFEVSTISFNYASETQNGSSSSTKGALPAIGGVQSSQPYSFNLEVKTYSY
jgi:Tfp pilus assembly protein PilO